MYVFLYLINPPCPPPYVVHPSPHPRPLSVVCLRVCSSMSTDKSWGSPQATASLHRSPGRSPLKVRQQEMLQKGKRYAF
jgi:hypothetical protein